MKFQKILALATLIWGAIVFVYALCFTSGNLADLLYYKNASLAEFTTTAINSFTGADDFISAQQTFVTCLLIFGIVYICVAAVLYITSSNSRRNYYITNYVAVGLAVAVAAVVAIYMIIDLSMLIVSFKNVDWEGIEYIRSLTNREGNLYLASSPDVSDSSVGVFIIGYVVALIALVNAVIWALTLVWKRKLMQGEKALLSGSAAEVAQ